MLKITSSIFLLTILVYSAVAQEKKLEFPWYSKSFSDGIKIENSLPKGGRYPGEVENLYNCSYLVFFTRITNEKNRPVNISLDLPANDFEIPNSPGTYVRLRLPSDKMTVEKISEFTYGLSDFDPSVGSTQHQKTLKPKEDFIFYVVAFFYQNKEGDWSHERGGNRSELALKDQELLLNMPPQVKSLSVGTITVK